MLPKLRYPNDETVSVGLRHLRSTAKATLSLLDAADHTMDETLAFIIADRNVELLQRILDDIKSALARSK